MNVTVTVRVTNVFVTDVTTRIASELLIQFIFSGRFNHHNLTISDLRLQAPANLYTHNDATIVNLSKTSYLHFLFGKCFSTEAGRLTGMSVHVSSIQGGISHTDDENLLQCVEQAYPLVGRLPRRALRLHDGQCGLDLDVSCLGPRITSPSYEVSDFARSVVTNLPSWLIPS